jgi:hypothetical protein
MRMQLSPTITLAVIVVAANPAAADTTFVSKLQVYADSDHTQVVSPVVDAQADVHAGTTVSIGYLADVVSSASVDIVSQASGRTIHDTRQQVSAAVSQEIGSLVARAGYSYSHENDYESHTLGAGLLQNLFDKNTTLALGYTLSLNTVGRAGDDVFSRALTVHGVTASWSQVISQRLITQVTYELGYATGFQASPYRFVPVRMSVDAVPEYWVAETDPDTRWRHAIVFAVNRAIPRGAIQADYRIYRDTWGITSHTIGARYFVNLSRHLELRLRERFYVQNGATFYQATYATPATYMTSDRELSPLWSQTLGGKLAYTFGRNAEAELKMDLFYYRYPEFPALASRIGSNVGLGVTLTY